MGFNSAFKGLRMSGVVRWSSNEVRSELRVGLATKLIFYIGPTMSQNFPTVELTWNRFALRRCNSIQTGRQRGTFRKNSFSFRLWFSCWFALSPYIQGERISLVDPCKKGDVPYGNSKSYMTRYRYAPHNDVSVIDGPRIRRWSHKIIILQYE